MAAAVPKVIGSNAQGDQTNTNTERARRARGGGQGGQPRSEPLLIRANAGDCVKVKVTNKLPTGGIPAHGGDVPLPVDAPVGKSNRVSMHASLAKYDVTRSGGATVGYNYDQTSAPGASRTYTRYAEPRSRARRSTWSTSATPRAPPPRAVGRPAHRA